MRFVLSQVLTILAIAVFYAVCQALTYAFVSANWQFFFAYLTGLIVAFGLKAVDEFKNKKCY